MSKLIYADSLTQDILDLPNCYNGFSDTYDKACIIGVIDEQQPVDAVEVVRCKDCKHYKEWESEFTPNAVVTQCMADNFPIRKAIPDGWFCAGAERRTDE